MENNPDKNEIIKRIKLSDRVVRMISKDGAFRISAIKNTNTAQSAQKKHKLSGVPAFLLARQLAAASIMASFLKGEERVIVEASGDGLVKRVFAEAIQVGEVRGYVDFDEEVKYYPYDSVSQILGDGLYKVSRVLYTKNEPVTGIVQLQKGDIATDLAHFYNKSEQVPSSVLLDVSIDDEGLIRQSGGIVVQALPGTSDRKIVEVYNILKNVDSLTNYLDKEYTPDRILREILPFELELLKSTRVDFFCRCSKERFTNQLLTLGIKEIKAIEEEGRHELVCHYCNEHYYLTPEDYARMYQELKAKEN